MASKYGHFKQQPEEGPGTWLRSIDTSSNNLKRGPGHGFEVWTLQATTWRGDRDMASKYRHFKQQPGEETGTWLRSMDTSSNKLERR